jgi:alpha-1,3-glucan synthase
MLSQLSKTIKLALKSTEEERAILRARSAVQRFPVVEWRQRMEDFHSRSVYASRGIAGHEAWRPSDGGAEGVTVIQDDADWTPVHVQDPSQPGWERDSVVSSPNSPGQWSDAVTPGGDPFLRTPGRLMSPDVRSSGVSSAGSDAEAQDYFSRLPNPNGPDFGSFLDKANKQIAREQRSAPDPFLEAPTRPFGAHNRVSSTGSISTIVDEKSDSPLNKAIASVRYARSIGFVLWLTCAQ